MPLLTVKNQPEAEYIILLDGDSSQVTPHTFDLASGLHTVSLVIPQPEEYPQTIVGYWVDSNGNILSREQQLSIDLSSDIEVIAVLTTIYPINPWVIIGGLGIASALILGIIHYLRRK